MNKIRTYTFAVLSLMILFIGCKDNPVSINENYTAELTLSSSHVHTLSPLTYTVVVKDNNGNVVTDMQKVSVERKGHGTTEWRETELTLSGTSYTGDYTFNSSGEYDIRVTGIPNGGTEAKVLYQMDEHMKVGRAHVEMGSFRIEYENFPGHVHDGESATVKFWVFESEKDASGNRPPVSGLDLHIHCANPDGTTEHHTTITEESSGVYVADHTFTGGGEAIMGTHFNDANNSMVEGEFKLHVAHGH